MLVQGDTNSVLGGALAAYKLGIPIAHLEAGLRSDDWEMPEEANRVLAGRIAALHLCPTETQRERLKLEGIVRGVEVVGNTVVDAALKSAERSRQRSTVVERLGLAGQPYGLVTLHRPSNVDSDDRLRTIMRELLAVAEKHALRLVFPIHPQDPRDNRPDGRRDALLRVSLRHHRAGRLHGLLASPGGRQAGAHRFGRRSGGGLHPARPLRHHPRQHRAARRRWTSARTCCAI